MNAERGYIPHYWARAGILAALSLYIVHLTKTDKLQLYIVPRMIPYVKFGALALFLLAGVYAYLAISRSDDAHGEPDCDCGHEMPRSALGNALLYGLFAIPLLLGFALPDKIMGSDVASVKGMNLNAAGASQVSSPPRVDAAPSERPAEPSADPDAEPPTEERAQPQQSQQPQPEEQSQERSSPPKSETSAADELDKLFPADEYGMDFAELGKKLYPKDTIRVRSEGFLEMLTMLDMYKDNFIGKDVEISGFVYREDDMRPDEFVVSRMAMQCCSADAMPYGFLVKSARGSALKKDTWITLTGTLATTDYRGNEIIRLEAKKFKTIHPPEDPYVYPYLDDLATLASGQ